MTPETENICMHELSQHVAKLLANGSHDIYRSVIHEVDRQLLREVMKHCDGKQFHAAERLGISRMTLRSKLRSLSNDAPESNGHGNRSEANGHMSRMEANV